MNDHIIAAALETVMAWNQQGDLTHCVNDRAHMMAGEQSDEIWTHPGAEDPYSLRQHYS